ncbi:hypothetical protein BSKO_04206 [Bryopsis sp. KO-2023]|nr:hypothetical protein BSKO_04206 [Bryopsis sp. KO-2023]
MALVDSDRWRGVDLLLERQGNVVGQNFAPNSGLRSLINQHIKLLCVGAGGLGCELLKDLALTGFQDIHVIDMDTIDVSNLNRQFLFRMDDVGKSKAEVAAGVINKRIPGARVTPHFCKIQDKDLEFYEQFSVVVLGLDSIEARRYMNQVVCELLEYGEDGTLEKYSMKPIIDGGTEGFKGNARVILPGITPCFECTLWLFPPETKFPLCTLAETPRSPAHCIEYAHIVLWEEQRKGEKFDADNEEHMKWMFTKATERASVYGIQGVTLQLTQGVVKNIIPAIASTNAIIAAACALEVFKVVSASSISMDNYMLYNGGDGVYTQTMSYEKDPECFVCSSGIPFTTSRTTTLQQFIDSLMGDARFSDKLTAPSITCNGERLYVKGVFEKMTRPNLEKAMGEMVQDSNAVLEVNDKKLEMGTLKIRLNYVD